MRFFPLQMGVSTARVKLPDVPRRVTALARRHTRFAARYFKNSTTPNAMYSLAANSW